MQSEFLNNLKNRGFIHQSSDISQIDSLAYNKNLIAYVGFDCTASSLHVGNLMSIMMLYWLQQSENTPIVLLGGGTTQIGDPSGKDSNRPLTSIESIKNNKETILKTFDIFLPNVTTVDNAEWLANLNYIEFLRDIGRHFSVNRMLSMDSVKLRLERDQELSFIEFNYMCLQSYDFVELHKRYGCNLQMGGSDQWGNIVSGIDLGRRLKTTPLHAITSPLLTTASGQKMGKTAQGAVWLNSDMLSGWDYWQFWRNIDDADVERFLKLFTVLPLDEIAKLVALQGSEINEAKKILATEATRMAHGGNVAENARMTAETTFEHSGIDLNLPTIEIIEECLKDMNILDVLIKTSLVSSKSDARRLITGRGLRINDNVIETDKIDLQLFECGSVIKFTKGKKQHVLVKVK